MPCSAKYFIPCFWKHKRACPIYADTSVDIHGYFYMWQIHKEHCYHNTYKGTREAQEKRFWLERQGLGRIPRSSLCPLLSTGADARPHRRHPTKSARSKASTPAPQRGLKEAADLPCAGLLLPATPPATATLRGWSYQHATAQRTPLPVWEGRLPRLPRLPQLFTSFVFWGWGRAAIHLKPRT